MTVQKPDLSLLVRLHSVRSFSRCFIVLMSHVTWHTSRMTAYLTLPLLLQVVLENTRRGLMGASQR